MEEITPEKKEIPIKQIISGIEHAFHEADANSSYEDDCWSSTKLERGFIIVKPKQKDLYNPEDIKKGLLERFSSKTYETTVSSTTIMFRKRSVM